MSISKTLNTSGKALNDLRFRHILLIVIFAFLKVLESTDGWEDYESRRQTKANKVIAGGAMIGDGTMDEGVDRRARRS